MQTTNRRRGGPPIGAIVLVLGSVAVSLLVAIGLYALIRHLVPFGHHITVRATVTNAPVPVGGGGGTVTDPLVIGRDTFRTAQALVTVLSYEPRSSATAPPPGGATWQAIEVRVCITAEATGRRYSVSNDPWTLLGPGDSAYAPSNVTDPRFPQPQYPLTGEEVAAGHCETGWVQFQVPANTTIRLVRYSVDRPVGGGKDTAYWRAD